MTSSTAATTPLPSANQTRKVTGRKLTAASGAGAPGKAESSSAGAKAAGQAQGSGNDVQRDRAPSKALLVLEMLQQPEGATLEQMVAATGWLPHTTRAMLTGLRKKGHAVTSEKLDGVRTYRVSAGQHQ